MTYYCEYCLEELVPVKSKIGIRENWLACPNGHIKTSKSDLDSSEKYKRRMLYLWKKRKNLNNV
jgi:hypothetical protein